MTLLERITLRIPAVAVAGCVWITLCGCAAENQPTTALQPATLGSTRNVHTFGETILAGQPSADDLELAKARGVKTIISLRLPDETDWDEKAAVEALGMNFHRIPFRDADALTDDVFDDVRTILNDNNAGPVMLHCASANRVGAVWLAHRVVDKGLTLEQAEQEANVVGLTRADYRDQAVRYAQQRAKLSSSTQDGDQSPATTPSE